jgi:predicted dehydrogenase
MQKKRYALVGTGSRAGMYLRAIANDFKDCSELVALCDINQGRMDYYNQVFLKKECNNHQDVPTFHADKFDDMIAKTRPDVIIITSVDRTHHIYGCRAMELGCDVISEKPMTVDTEKCQQIIDTQKKTGRDFRVTFNYRYIPRNTKIKELLREGIIGDITTVHFEWMLDTSHGADYFRRWHRDKRNSGGLMVHKSTHHFDLVNWWLDSLPDTVFAMGGLKFYGKENAEKRGVTEFYQRSRYSEIAQKDPFALKIAPGSGNDLLYYQTEKYDGYQRDQSVFGDGISIEDNMSVMVRYRNGAVMNYTLCAHAPWEGYRVTFNGTKGRLELNSVGKAITERNEDMSTFGLRDDENTAPQLDRKAMTPEIVVQKHWEAPFVCEYTPGVGGHGGGDPKLLANLFAGVKDDELGHAADFRDGALSILTGIGANISMQTGQTVKVSELINMDI